MAFFMVAGIGGVLLLAVFLFVLSMLNKSD